MKWIPVSAFGSFPSLRHKNCAAAEHSSLAIINDFIMIRSMDVFPLQASDTNHTVSATQYHNYNYTGRLILLCAGP